MALASILTLAAGTGVVFLILRATARFIQDQKYARDHGCQPANHTMSYGLFGLGWVMDMLSAARENNFLGLVRSWHREMGHTFKAKTAGRTVVFTVEPRNIQTVLALKFNDFELGHNRTRAMRPLTGHGIFTSDGARWEHSRALLRPNFTRNQISDFDVHERHVTALMRRIPRDGSTVDLQDLFLRMTLDSSTEFLFGESAHSLDDETLATGSTFATNFNISEEGLATRSRIGPLMFFHRDPKFFNAVEGTRAYVDQFVQRAIDYRIALDSGNRSSSSSDKKDKEGYVFLYELSKQTLDRTELTDQLVSILIAGRDTTAGLLSMTFYVLARRPEIWTKLRELVLGLQGRKPSFEDLKAMTYLTWVLNETLRLYPVVPINVRMASKDTHLPLGGGPDGKSPLHVHKGEDIMYSVYTMHRLPETFGPDAEEFRPERWEKTRPGWGYLPFNGGPRICIGQQFALTEAAYTIVRILQEFETIESRDPRPFEEYLNITMSSFHGTMVSMVPCEGPGHPV